MTSLTIISQAPQSQQGNRPVCAGAVWFSYGPDMNRVLVGGEDF